MPKIFFTRMSRTPLKYLIDHKIKYTEIITPKFNDEKDFLKIDRTDFTITLKDLYNITIISAPAKLNTTDYEDCKEVCIDLEYFICNDLKVLPNPDETCCEPVFENEIEESCIILPDGGAIKCENIPKHIFIRIYHNFTKGIEKVQVFFEILHSTDVFYSTLKVDRIFEVKYAVAGHRQNVKTELSGNPGYLLGKPLLNGKFIEIVYNTTNNKQKKDYVIDYFHEKVREFNTRHIFTLPVNVRGHCKLTNSTYNTINFGVNLRTKCELKLGKLEVTKTTNLTLMCLNVQTKIFFSILGNKDKLNNYVSVFGKPKNLTSEWLKLVYHKDTNYNITGSKKDNYLLCKNVVYYVSYYFLYLNLDFLHLSKQSRILRAGVKYGEQVNIKINLDDPRVTVGVEVLFTDVTNSKDKEVIKETKQTKYLIYPFSILKNHGEPIKYKNHIYLILLILMHCIITL